MAILEALLTALVHSAGKILNTIFGWATILLFGRVAEKQQILMSVSSALSLLWLLCVVSLAFPLFGLFLIGLFVPPQAASHQNLIRLSMLPAVVLIPFIVGILALFGEKEKQKSGFHRWLSAALSGWSYTIGLALTLILMIVIAPIMKVTALTKRWTSQHVPILIKPHEYEKAAADVESALRDAGITFQRKHASWMVTFPTRVLMFFARNKMQGMVADQLAVFTAKDFEVMLHPSDLTISGKEKRVARIRSILAEKLAFSHASLTWTEEANQLEQRLRSVWLQVTRGNAAVIDELRRIDGALSNLEIEYDEWQVLSREKAQIEHELLQRLTPQQRRRAS